MSFFLNDSTEFPLINFGGKFNPFFYIVGNDGVLDPSVSFSRASTGTTEITQGVFSQAAVNEPRYKWVGGKRGLLIEEGATNLVKNSVDCAFSFAADAAKATTSVTKVIDGEYRVTTTVTASTYNEIFFSTDFPDPVGTAILTSSEIEIFWENGDASGILFGVMQAYSPYDGSLVSLSSLGVIAGKWCKVKYLSSMTLALISQLRSCCFAMGGTVGSYSFKVRRPQVLRGNLFLSYIPTTGSPASRAPDLCGINSSTLGFNANEGTFLIEYVATTGSNAELITGNIDSCRFMYQLAVDQNVRFYDGTNITQSATPVTANAINKIAMTYKNKVGSICVNGGAVASGAFNPAVISSILLGRLSSGVEFLNSSFLNVRYASKYYSDAELQRLTI